jgi:hypothetical protein
MFLDVDRRFADLVKFLVGMGQDTKRRFETTKVKNEVNFLSPKFYMKRPEDSFSNISSRPSRA